MAAKSNSRHQKKRQALHRKPKLPVSFRPMMEVLEDRRLLAVYTVPGLGSAAETINIVRQGDVDKIDVTVGGSTTSYTTPAVGTLDRIDVSALGGDDALIVDLSGGDPIPGGYVQYDGGSGAGESNFLQLINGDETRFTHVKLINGDKTDVAADKSVLMFSDADVNPSFRSLVLQSGAVVLSGGGKSLTVGSLTVSGIDNSVQIGAGSLVDFTGGSAFSITASSRLTKDGSGTLLIDEPQSHGSGAELDATSGRTNFNTNAGGASLSKTLAVRASNSQTIVSFRSTQHLKSLVVDTGALAQLTDGSAKRLWLDGLDIDLSSSYSTPSQLDLGNGLLVVSYAAQPNPSQSIQAMLRSAYAASGLNGPGITSSTVREENVLSSPFSSLTWADNGAAGYTYVEPNNRLSTSASGNLALASSSVVVNYGITGDANLDGVVNSTDQTALTNGTSSQGAPGSTNNIWGIGDFNYSGVIDSADQTLLSTGQSNQTSANRSPIVLSGTVPTVQQGGTLRFTVSAVDPTMKASGQTANGLSFSLDSPPSGASIDAATGDVTWVNVPSGSQSLTVRATQTGGGSLSSTRTFSVSVDSSVDLAISSGGFTTSGDGQALLEVNYSLASAVAAPFNIGIFSSTSSSGTSSDTRLTTFRVDDPSLWMAGAHVVTFRPDWTDPDADYYLVARIDADNEISEPDETNNVAAFSGGVFLSLDGTIHVHGSDAADTVKTDSTSEVGTPKIYFNGTVIPIAGDVPVTQLHVRLHGGTNTFSDDMDPGNWVFPEWIYGGSSVDAITVRNSYSIVDGGGATDIITVAGTARADTVDVNSGGVQINGSGRTVFRNAETIAIATDVGDDRIRYEGIPSGTTAVTIDAGGGEDYLDVSGFVGGTVAIPSSVTGVESLDLSHDGLTSLASTYFNFITDKSTVTTLDLRYNAIDLSVGTALSSVATNLASLQSLLLYGNTNFDVNPVLSALAGKWLRVDLAPVDLAKAEASTTQTAALAALAKSLHYLPLEIYEYVLNNYRYEPYAGRMKDPLTVIQTHAGNDWDLSNLLIQLFTSAGISPGQLRFARNKGDDYSAYLSPEDARDWLGTSENASTWNQDAILPIIDAANYHYTYSAVSFETWFNVPTGSSGVILGQVDGPAPGAGNPTAGWTPVVQLGTDGKLRSSMFWHGSSSNRLTSPGTTTYNDGQWHHVAVTYGSGTETMYIDGVAVAQQSLAQDTAPDYPYQYYLGVGYTGGWTGGNGGWQYLNGKLDQAAIYLRTLSASTIAQHYASGASGNAAALYKFDETTRTTADDSSGNNSNATYVNSPTLGLSGALSSGTAVQLNGTNQYIALPLATFGSFGADLSTHGIHTSASGPLTGVVFDHVW
jgi:hypothetical protein